MLRAYQYRLYPSKNQQRSLWKLLKLGCWLYNTALAERREAWEKDGKSISYHDQAAKLKELRNTTELGRLNFSACQQVLRRLDKAFQAFFRRLEAGEKPGYPRFKKPHRFRTLEFVYNDGLRIKKDRLYIQNVGLVKVLWHRSLPEGRIKQAWVTKKADGWYVTFAVDVPEDTLRRLLPPLNTAVGIDVGIENLLTLSDGKVIENPRWYQKTERKLAEKQRILSKKRKGSKRWKRMCKQIAKLYLKLARQRQDFYWKLAWDLCRRFGFIIVEDLNMDGLTQGNLSKQVLDASWGLFLNRTLSDVAWRAGRMVVKVNPNGTSQVCSRCGFLVPKNLSVRVHRCPYCGLTVHRDVNAALNILHLGLEQALGGSNAPVPERS